MNLKARKYQLIERVMQFNEGELKKMEAFLDQTSESELSASLEKSMQQVQESKTVPHSEVRKKYEKWL